MPQKTAPTTHIDRRVLRLAADVKELAPDHLLTVAQLSEVLGISVSTLNGWRCHGVGPPFVRLGGDSGSIRYRCQELRNWLDERVLASTRTRRKPKAAPVPPPTRRRVALPDWIAKG